MRTCPAGMGGGVCAFSAVAAANKKKQKAEKSEMARHCMVHTPGLVGELIFARTLLHETPASGLRTLLRYHARLPNKQMHECPQPALWRLYAGAPRIIT